MDRMGLPQSPKDGFSQQMAFVVVILYKLQRPYDIIEEKVNMKDN